MAWTDPGDRASCHVTAGLARGDANNTADTTLPMIDASATAPAASRG
jgi:hypothetical protein